ncbi:MAG: FHA domain-containing protein, partial [Cyanobacteria bacterium J06649_4]
MPTTDRLQKKLDALQLLIQQHIESGEGESREDHQNVGSSENLRTYQRLEAIRQSVATPQLVINIVGDSSAAMAKPLHGRITALQAQLSRHESLSNHYQVNAVSVSIAEAPAIPVLKLQPAALKPGKNLNETLYRLTQTSQQTIGRNPAVAQILLGDELALVSGAHAEMQKVEGDWYIQDTQSRNGTFINGSTQRLEGQHRLQVGDLISLGAPTAAPGSAHLIYAEVSSEEVSNEENSQEQTIASETLSGAETPPIESIETILDCNTLCVIANIAESPSSVIKDLLIQAGSASSYLTEIVVVPDSSAAYAIATSQKTPTATRSQSLESWLQQQSFAVPVSYKELFEKPPSLEKTSAPDQYFEVNPTELEAFTKALSKLAERKFDRLFANRIKAQMAGLAATVEHRLSEQKESIQAAISQIEHQPPTNIPSDFKDSAREAQRKVSSDKDWFFRQVKNELMQAKADLLNDFKNSSITNKLSQFINSLGAQTSSRKGFSYMQLKTPDGDLNIHEQTMALIHNELAHWVHHEWEKVAITYVGQGFRGLVEQSRETLRITPALALPNDLFPELQIIDPSQGLQGSLVAHETESRYPKQNIFSYLLRNLRGQLFGIVGLLSIVGGGFGIISGGRNTLMLIAAPVVIIFLCFAFLKEKKENQEKEEEKL